MTDFKFAFRQFWKAPGFTAAAVIVLALGIGANTAVFSLVHAILFTPPSYHRPAEIVQVFSQDKKNPKSFRAFSYATYCDIRDHNNVFDGVFAHDTTVVGLGENGETRRTTADMVSANYFSVLGVAPAAGRAFLPEEETPGRGERVAIVSYSYWQKQGRDSALLGRTLTLNGRPFTIVGIMPKGFTGTTSLFAPEVWVPLGVYEEVTRQLAGGRKTLSDRGASNLLLVARLKPGVTAAAALPNLQGLAANEEAAFPLEQKDQTFMTAPLSRFGTSTDPEDAGPMKTIGALLTGMAAVVLIVACLNLANMLLARGTARRKEIAIRLALGGSRRRIVRQLLTEGFVLALMGGACGLLLGLWSLDLLIASLARIAPDLVWVSGTSPIILVAALVFALLGTLAFALGPALKLSRVAAIDDLKLNAAEDHSRPRWKYLPRNPLLVVQIALSLALVTAAGLFIRSATTAASVDLGLRVEQSFLVEVDASLGGFDQNRAQDLYRAIGERLGALPAVKHASIAALVPLGNSSIRRSVQRAGSYPESDAKPATAADGQTFSANWNSVGADYFATVGLPLLRGRSFTAAEATQPGGPAVAIIDEILAKKLWPEGDALGQRLQFPLDKNAAPETAVAVDDGEIKRGAPIEIIGIVPASKMSLFGNQQPGALYLPFARGYLSNVFFFVKFASVASGSEAATADLLRRTVQSVDPVLPILTVKTFAQHFDTNAQLWTVRAGAALFSVFGILALGLSVVGVYGVKAYSVGRRTREIGIRMSLGAQRNTVQWMILREGSAMLGAGLALGLLLALATGKVVSSMLYQVSSLDPITFTVAPIVLALAGLLATWLPARRATRISPMAALRTE